MDTVNTCMKNYLEYCHSQKCLDEKTLKAYRIDLRQFSEQNPNTGITEITAKILEQYIARLHEQYKPKTVKRKIASVKAFFHYLEYREIIEQNPFNKIQIHFREPVILPKTIPLPTIELFLATIYNQEKSAKTTYQKRNALRDAAVSELLFATGMRISELCSLKDGDINLYDGTILIYGKGDKERRIQIGTEAVLHILVKYRNAFHTQIQSCSHFFVNQSGKALSDQQRPAGTRMGSGKGAPEYWVAVVKPGRVMFEIAGIDESIAREALRLAANKLPVKCKFVKAEDVNGAEGGEQ